MSLKIIYDTNIFLDAIKGHRLGDILTMKHTLFVSESILAFELVDYIGDLMPFINQQNITCLKFDDAAFKKCIELKQKYPKGVNLYDLSSLALALLENLDHLATAENQLRSASAKEGVPPLYILDLIGFLLEEGRLTKNEAQKFYDDAFPVRKPNFEKMIQEQLSA